MKGVACPKLLNHRIPFYAEKKGLCFQKVSHLEIEQ